jgi:hypothetical protein
MGVVFVLGLAGVCGSCQTWFVLDRYILRKLNCIWHLHQFIGGIKDLVRY